jgi:hypothetical protein
MLNPKPSSLMEVNDEDFVRTMKNTLCDGDDRKG